MIAYRDVHKAFGDPVLNGVDLTVRSGERVSIVGPSGVGKSVLLKTALGLVVPDRGDVLIDGESVVWAQPSQLERIRRKVGYVFQRAALFDSMTVFENVSQGLPEEVLASMPVGEVVERVSAALAQVNLQPSQVLGMLPATLSGGMQKRVGLARAIIGGPRIILYDEPLTGLDPVNAATVERLMGDIGDRMGVTSVMVTHDIESALDLSDRIALLDAGRVRFIGTPTEFKASGDPLVRAFASRQAAASAVRDGAEPL